MTTRLHWREARLKDRPALAKFRCAAECPEAPDGRLLPHPEPWHRAVDLGLATVFPPVADGVMLLGEDDIGRITAVALLLDAGREAGIYFVKLAAVAVDRERQRDGYGPEAIEVALREAESRAFGAGYSTLTVVGWVDPRNEPSRKACAKAGLAHRLDLEKYEEWGVTIELPPEMHEN